MPNIPINIVCANGSIKAVPDKANAPFGQNAITWNVAGNVTVTSITFDSPNAPYSPPQQSGNQWTSSGNNNNTTNQPQPWPYTIQGSCSGSTPGNFDPEIVNDPKGG